MSYKKLFLEKGGEMGSLTRTYDWVSTSIGIPETWSQSHLAFVNMMLTSRFPMLIFWGKDLITFYNDAFRPSLGNDGKHPGSLGQPGHISWAESWPVIGPMIENIMQGGEAVWFEDQKLPLYRDGKMGYAYWTYSFSPLLDDNGSVGGVLVTCNETTKSVESTEKMAESESRFRTMAEASPILIAVGDENGKAIYFNEAWVKITGRTIEELLVNGWIDLMHPEDTDRVVKIYMSAFEKQVPWEWEFRMPDKKSGYTWLLARGTPRFHPDGRFAGYVSATIDITERKKDEQRKNDFIGMVSHELKTPITLLTGYHQILIKNAAKHDDAFSAGMLEKAAKQVKKMTTMINGFLNVSRLESGKIHIDKQRFDMADLVKEIEAETLSTINTHHVVFAPVEPTPVLADRDKIGQVVTNLISNAVKYSTQGSTINIACITTNAIAMISVKDEGIGVSAEDLDKLFERYYRVDNQNTRHISGFSIGLYLCREIIERHQGTISAKSELGNGSTFYFTLPVKI